MFQHKESLSCLPGNSMQWSQTQIGGFNQWESVYLWIRWANDSGTRFWYWIRMSASDGSLSRVSMLQFNLLQQHCGQMLNIFKFLNILSSTRAAYFVQEIVQVVFAILTWLILNVNVSMKKIHRQCVLAGTDQWTMIKVGTTIQPLCRLAHRLWRRAAVWAATVCFIPLLYLLWQHFMFYRESAFTLNFKIKQMWDD